MDIDIVTAPQRSSEIPESLRLDPRTPRTSLLDRLALRVGLALLIWSTRSPRVAIDRDEHRRAHEARRAGEQREHENARRALLLPPLR